MLIIIRETGKPTVHITESVDAGSVPSAPLQGFWDGKLCRPNTPRRRCLRRLFEPSPTNNEVVTGERSEKRHSAAHRVACPLRRTRRAAAHRATIGSRVPNERLLKAIAVEVCHLLRAPLVSSSVVPPRGALAWSVIIRRFRYGSPRL